MIKRIYIGVITLITLCCIIIGVMGNTSGGWFDWDTEDKDIPLEEINLDKYQNVTIQGDIMEVEFIPGENYKLSYECTEGLEPTYSIENDGLKIIQKKKRKKFWGIHNQHCKVIIEIPKAAVLGNLDIQLDVGEVDMKYIQTENTQISIDVGEIDIENCKLGNTITSTDTGDVNIKESEFVNMEAEVDVGEIEITSITSLEEYSMELKSDIGEVSVNNQEYGKKYENNAKSDYKLKATVDVGEIDIQY